MKLANIEDPAQPGAIRKYAEMNRFKVIEIYDKQEIPIMQRMIQTCLKKAKERGCVEFCIKQLRDEYVIHSDQHLWHVSIYGFLPETD